MSISVLDERKHERIFRSDRVVFRVVPGTACPAECRRESSGRTADLSEGGACIVTDVPVPARAVLEVRITVINPPAIFSHRATVRWSRRSESDQIWRTGVEFQFASQNAESEWKALVRQLREVARAEAVTAA